MKNIIENNKLIAEFLNLTSQVIFEQVFIVSENGKTKFYKKDELKFHSDWNWLMEVVEKIESLGYRIEIVKHICRVYLSDKETIIISENIPKIEAVYNACIEFIKWYNENK
jgi:hypothetical protein